MFLADLTHLPLRCPSFFLSIAFRFTANICTVEDSTTDAEIRRAQALGTIEIVLRTAKFNGFKEGFGDKRGNRHWEVADPADIPGYPYSEISEKALKGRSITHSIAWVLSILLGATNI